ncbi:putative U11/U12 small nuclear ribonucleoprotein 25kDa protein [Helianthus debilis subsp. tardiflorus]
MIMCLQIYQRNQLYQMLTPSSAWNLGVHIFCWFLVWDTDVTVMNSATVKDLKLVVEKKVNEIEQSKMGHRHISCLAYH